MDKIAVEVILEMNLVEGWNSKQVMMTMIWALGCQITFKQICNFTDFTYRDLVNDTCTTLENNSRNEIPNCHKDTESTTTSETQQRDLANGTGTNQGNNSSDEIPNCHIDTDGTETSVTLQRDKKSGAMKKKPYRPCPFCRIFQSKLSLHLERKHKNEPEVKTALGMPKVQKLKVFDKLKKDGILNENRDKLQNGNFEEIKTHLLKERNTCTSDVAMCSLCNGFYSSKNISRHKQICSENEKSNAIPVTVKTALLQKDNTLETSKDLNELILSKFRDDEIGNTCRTDEAIKIFGETGIDKVLARKVKRHTLREKLMGDMRKLASIYLISKEKARSKKIYINSCDEMFNKSHLEFVHDAILELSKKEDGSQKNGLCVGLGFLLKKACSVFYRYYKTKNDNGKVQKFDDFLSNLNLYWDRWFGEAQYNNEKNRQAILRKPKRLPSDEDVRKLRDHSVKSIEKIVSDTYRFSSQEDFVTLRDLLVCRLTVFNARRGGEACRLLLTEWNDAEKGEWMSKNVNINNIEDPVEKHLIQEVKIAYQAGKNVKHLVPVLIPKDCIKGMRKLADPVIRRDASVHKKNPYVFANTKHSDRYVKGWNCVQKVASEAGVGSHVTATTVRHRVSTLYANLDVPECEREAFYRHMGHSKEINMHVYQSPLVVQEVTKVGKFLSHLDQLTAFSRQSSVQEINETPLQQSEGHTDRHLEASSSQSSGQDTHESSLQQSKGHSDRKLQESQQTDQDEFQEPTQQSKRHTHRHLDRKCSNKEIHAPIHEDYDDIVCEESDDSFKPWSSDSSSEPETVNIEDNIGAASKELSELECGGAAKVHKKRMRITTRARWTHQEEESLRKYFYTVINEFSLPDTKGSLPGRMDLRMFLEKQPKSFLANIPEEEKIMKIHMKLFNERAKCRRVVQLRETKLKK